MNGYLVVDEMGVSMMDGTLVVFEDSPTSENEGNGMGESCVFCDGGEEGWL